MISSWAIAAFIVVLVLFLRERRLTSRLEHQNRQLIKRVTHLETAIYPQGDTPKQEPLDPRELDQLRERIQVLERIATDENSSDARERARITAEIEALRGLPTAPQPRKEERSE